ncbi:MAG: ABC transporter permease subunit, partial [Actinomycetota bacterium]
MIARLTKLWNEAGPPRRLAVAGVLALAVLLLPLPLSKFWQSILIDMLLFALLALGLNVVVGFAGLLDLGYVAFYAIGNYVFGIITTGDYAKALFLEGGVNLPPPPVWETWMWLLIPLGLIAAMVTGVLLGAPT